MSLVLQDRALLLRAHEVAIEEREDNREFATWYSGVVDALAWTTGLSSVAPISGRTPADRHHLSGEPIVGTDAGIVANELGWIDDMLHGGRPMHPRGQKYVLGCEHALLWARGATEDPPVFGL